MEREGELIRGSLPAGGQRGFEGVIRVLARVELRHRLDHLAFEHPDDGEGGVRNAVEAGRLLVDAHHQSAAALRCSLRDALLMWILPPVRVRVLMSRGR